MPLGGGKMTGWRLCERGPGWRDAYLCPLLDPDALACAPGARVLQRSRLNRVVSITLDKNPLVLKLFEEGPWGRWLQSLVLGSAARRAARSARRLKEAGFSAPDVVAVLEKGRLLSFRKSCLLVALISGPTVEEIWERLAPPRRRRMAEQLGAYVRSLHLAGLYPQDLRAANLIASARGEDWRFVLVDLDRVRSYRSLSFKRRIKNLVQLNRSVGRRARAPERMRFLLAYAGGSSKGERRRIAAAVAELSERKESEYNRREAGARGGGGG